MTEIKDAAGVIAEVGDIVYFALGGRGAQEFVRGRVEKVNAATITISHGRWKWNNVEYVWVDDNSAESKRKSGCFVLA